ncbi:hypothetical protein WKI13_11580 [Teredinibacter turnerae]|uniref:hypothetical protein n=1 Tax=Teredinibacter turnerae TaxID=2426 RepID=UPI00036FEDDA|nr:hypothetical protein [Teredinibacter turnerae]
MFKKKIYITDEDLGRFEWSSDNWFSENSISGLAVSVCGSKSEMYSTSLEQAKKLIDSRQSIEREAIAYLGLNDIAHFSALDQLYLSGIYSSTENGVFDIEFGVNGWEDAYVLVHFKEGKPEALSLGD